MQSSFVFFFILIGIIFGNWKHWSDYYPTLLFCILGNLLYGVALYNYRMWEFIPVGIDHLLMPTHTVIGLGIALVGYPFVIPVYLGRFPKTFLSKIAWIILWTFIFQMVETIAFINHSITYHHGWSWGWSLFFNIVVFTLMPIHKWKPSLAWFLSILNVIFLWLIFSPPIPK